MPGIEDDGEIGIVRVFSELADQAVHAGIVLIDAFEHLETGIAQRRCDQARVVRRVGQRHGVDIFAVADDQRDALDIGRGGLGAERGKHKQDKSTHKDGERFH